MSLGDRLRAVDRFQQSRPAIGFVAAVIKKFTDDQAGSLAALMAYYGFVSIFPLLLVFVTVLGFIIHGDPSQQRQLLSGTVGQIPLLKDPLTSGASLRGSAAALVIGLVGSLLAGLGITNAAQNAFNRIWHVPFKHRPNFLKMRLRGLGMLFVLGLLNVISTTAAGFTTAVGSGPLADATAIVVAFAFNLALFGVAFRMLTTNEVHTRDLLPGVVSAAVFWQVLQHLGGYWASRVKQQEALYGTFGLVLGLLAFLFIGAQLTILAAEINVVRVRRLWPRSLFSPPLTEADRRALTSSAETEERIKEENVEVSFDTTAHDAETDARADPPRPGGGHPERS